MMQVVKEQGALIRKDMQSNKKIKKKNTIIFLRY